MQPARITIPNPPHRPTVGEGRGGPLPGHWLATDSLGAGTHAAPVHWKLRSCECQEPPSNTAGRPSGPTCVSMRGHTEASCSLQGVIAAMRVNPLLQPVESV